MEAQVHSWCEAWALLFGLRLCVLVYEVPLPSTPEFSCCLIPCPLSLPSRKVANSRLLVAFLKQVAALLLASGVTLKTRWLSRDRTLADDPPGVPASAALWEMA